MAARLAKIPKLGGRRTADFVLSWIPGDGKDDHQLRRYRGTLQQVSASGLHRRCFSIIFKRYPNVGKHNTTQHLVHLHIG